MSTESELKEIRSLLLKLNKKVDGLNDLVKERLIGLEEPTEEDAKAIEEYETAEKNGKLCLVPLKDLTQGN